MKQTNPLIYVGFIIHTLVTLVVGSDEEILLLILAIPLLVNLVGICLLTFTDHIKLGAKIFMWSSFLYVPIGLVGITGARKVLDALTEKDFFKKEAHD